ncbi:hypothetical protein SAMN05446037_101044 [Anaerovirgula multivorans]|uniref:Uncharacterized protein n=1 Tax=Anaerovirgula multivorans TaxID=312168 RepID=A0A239EJX4_9FIRM|nr:hypothetical protein SAMN05446037_101044 [Anaerovirgula multivorans]
MKKIQGAVIGAIVSQQILMESKLRSNKTDY